MKEYQEVLDFAGNRKEKAIARQYLEKYWLSKDEYEQKWLPIQQNIFNLKAKYLPEMMFRDEYELMVVGSGAIFPFPNDFQLLKECMKLIGDKYFAIIENDYKRPYILLKGKTKVLTPYYRLRYPVDITYEDLNSGENISHEVFDESMKEFFLFGDSGKWGIYVANEFINHSVNDAGTPLNIAGVKKEYANLFASRFRFPEEDKETIRAWLPPDYLERCQKYL